MAVVFCALGIFLMAVPEKAVKIICVLAGILFLADGIIKIIGYFSRDFYCLAFQFDLGFGILMIAVGILILVRRDQTIYDFTPSAVLKKLSNEMALLAR